MRNFVILTATLVLSACTFTDKGNHAEYITCVRKAERSAPTSNPVGNGTALRRHIEAEKSCSHSR